MTQSGYDAMGKPIPSYRMSAGLTALRTMCDYEITTDRAMAIVGAVAQRLELDEPYDAFVEAQKAGLDLTGAYRLIAVLLTAEPVVTA